MVEEDIAVLPLRIQVLDDDEATLSTLRHVLSAQGWEVITSKELNEATAQLNAVLPEVVIVDVYLGAEDGLEYVRRLKRDTLEVGILVISADDTETLARTAVQSGADYFLSKPISPAALILTVKKVAELREQRLRSRQLKQEFDRSVRDHVFPEILTHSDSMKGVLRLVEKVSGRDLSVLICGESGTGKELVARAVHQNSPRARGPFIELNCAALPPNLVESELFGHEKGAFTGAVAARAGKIELAHGGTLFLDEIGELPLEIQPKLLRALQEKRIVRIGGKRDILSDFRLVTATHRDLLLEVRRGTFREDLFYRVAVFPIKLPPLRERMEDLDLLLSHFLRMEGVAHPRIFPEAQRLLQAYNWPGNIRELKNFAQSIPLLIDNGLITEDSVRNYFGTRMGQANGDLNASLGGYQPHVINSDPRPVRKLADVEREEILHALRFFRGNVPEAAMALAMGRATLYKYIKKNQIDLEAFAD